MKEYVAYYSANNDLEYFDTFEDAEKWLKDIHNTDGIDEGFTEETISGEDFIAKITHVSEYIICDKKEDYHEHTDDCPDDCDEEEWPYNSDHDTAGKVIMKSINSAPCGAG